MPTNTPPEVESAPQKPRHFSHCKGCGYTFTCEECGRLCGACFDTDEEHWAHQVPLCAECAHNADERERENDEGWREYIRANPELVKL